MSPERMKELPALASVRKGYDLQLGWPGTPPQSFSFLGYTRGKATSLWAWTSSWEAALLLSA